MTRIRPGVSATIRDEAKAAMVNVFGRTRFSKPIYERGRTGWSTRGRPLPPVSMAVTTMVATHAVLKPGHVFSIDPQTPRP